VRQGLGGQPVSGALVVAILGAAAIMGSPITPWTLGVAFAGALAAKAAAAVLVLWLVRRR
jgi:hypothetical protein